MMISQYNGQILIIMPVSLSQRLYERAEFCFWQEQDSDDQFQTTSQDLAGFWDMVLIQVEDVLGMFEDIEKMRQNGWREIRTTPVSISVYYQQHYAARLLKSLI